MIRRSYCMGLYQTVTAYSGNDRMAHSNLLATSEWMDKKWPTDNLVQQDKEANMS